SGQCILCGVNPVCHYSVSITGVSVCSGAGNVSFLLMTDYYTSRFSSQTMHSYHTNQQYTSAQGCYHETLLQHFSTVPVGGTDPVSGNSACFANTDLCVSMRH